MTSRQVRPSFMLRQGNPFLATFLILFGGLGPLPTIPSIIFITAGTTIWAVTVVRLRKLYSAGFEPERYDSES